MAERKPGTGINKKFEKALCAVCEKDNAERLFAKNGFSIARCMECGLVYVNPRLDGATRREMYEKDLLDPFGYLFQNREADAKTFSRHMALIGEFHKNKGKLLDVGCGIGVLLGVAKSRGWEVRGVELTRQFSQYCRKQGFDVVQGTLKDAKFPDGFFDAIAMTGSLEHMPEPLETLKLARKKIKPDGILLITTPDIGSVHAKLLGRHWLQIKPDEHLYYFSKSTIKKILEKSGFEVVHWEHVGNMRTLGTVVEKIFQMLGMKAPKKITAPLAKISFVLNPHDEMLVLAKPAGMEGQKRRNFEQGSKCAPEHKFGLRGNARGFCAKPK